MMCGTVVFVAAEGATSNDFLYLCVCVFSGFQEGVAFLAANKVKEGVATTSSGLQYKVLKSGPEEGKTPLKSTKCLCHYRGERD